MVGVEWKPPPSQTRALKALADYTLLTIELGVQVGIARHRSEVGHAFAQLQRLKFVDSEPKNRKRAVGEPVSFIPGLGTPTAIFWLTAKGADFLNELDGTEAIGARRRMKWLNEGAHRLDIVRAHIELKAWAASAGARVPQIIVDFEPGSKGREKATMFKWRNRITGRAACYPPDAVAQVRLPTGINHLLVIEVERGGSTADLSAFWEKLPRLRALAEAEQVEVEYRLDHAARFVVLFRTERMRQRALMKWPEPEAEVWSRFFVKSYEEASMDYNASWHQPGRQSRPLFQLPA